jgi:CheY-like chemotaxis protein
VSPSATSRLPRILSVEDNIGDATLLREALIENGLSAELEIIATGHQAIARLEGNQPYQDDPLPDLVILDLNLPGIYGHELLSLIRDHERLRELKTVILTSSDDPEEAAFCRARGVDAYMIKPMGMEGYGAIVRAIAALLAEDGFGAGASAEATG